MALSYAYAAQPAGLRGHIVTVEVDLFRGFHAFSVVGLPDKAVEESRDRISSAIRSTGFTAPKESGQKKITIALAPADLKKEGPLFDVAMALAYLQAIDEIRFSPEKRLFLGELSLAGEVRPIKGALALTRAARDAGFSEVFLPASNAREAALVHDISVFGACTLGELIAHINTKRLPEHRKARFSIDGQKMAPRMPTPIPDIQDDSSVRLEDIRGQSHAKRGLEIAAAGGHNIAFYGPPGTGKTLLAKALSSILPPLSFEETLEVTSIHSLSGALQDDIMAAPPFRAPHHTASHTAVIGGGAIPKPGEITLAHKGILFLDEFPEFDRRVIESLRQPLEEGIANVARVRGSERFPAEFILAVALNPCPCGYAGDSERDCTCTYAQLSRYRRKLSGPIIDRIDMWIEVPRIDYKELVPQSRTRDTGESKETRRRVLSARNIQKTRQGGVQNGRLPSSSLEQIGLLEKEAEEQLSRAARSLMLSPRAYHRVIKLARTIADLEEEDVLSKDHILEAVSYRPKFPE